MDVQHSLGTSKFWCVLAKETAILPFFSEDWDFEALTVPGSLRIGRIGHSPDGQVEARAIAESFVEGLSARCPLRIR